MLPLPKHSGKHRASRTVSSDKKKEEEENIGDSANRTARHEWGQN